jgi:subtilisin family serine protease
VIEVAGTGNTESGPVLRAPGREILTLLPGGHYDFASGDSIATAEVSGVLALLLARKPGLSSAEALRLLRDSSRSDAAQGEAARGDAPGEAAALVDACAAVVALVGHGACDADGDRERKMAAEHPERVALH